MRRNALVAFALALTALAAVPTLAQAVVKLESPVGTEVKPGTTIILDSKNLKIEPSIEIACSDFEIGGMLTSNSDPAIELTSKGASAGCAGSGLTATVSLAPPTRIAFGEESGTGEARIYGVTMNISFFSGGMPLAECTYTGNLFPTYTFGTNLALEVPKTGLTRVSGGSLCHATMPVQGTFQVSTLAAGAVRATSEAPKAGSFGLFRNSGGTRSHVFAGEVVQSSSKNPSFKLAGGKVTVTCGNALLYGAATQPAAKPALTSVSTASFTGEGAKGCSWSGLEADVTTNASGLSFGDESGKSATGFLVASEGPVRVTIRPYLFGSPLATCVYEASSIGTTYSFEKALGLKFTTTTMTRVSGEVATCTASVEANLGEGTVTVPNAGNLPVEVLAG